MSHHQHSSHAHGTHDGFNSPEMVLHAESDGEVLADLSNQAMVVLSQFTTDCNQPIRRILDIGSGPGVGTSALAQHFPEAEVVAVDGSAAMLDRVDARAAGAGLEGRVSTVNVQIPEGFGSLGKADLVWASQVLHHAPDSSDLLAQIGGLLNPGGFTAVIEPTGALRVTPPNAGPDVEEFWSRIDVAWKQWFENMWGPELPNDVSVSSELKLQTLGSFKLHTTLPSPLSGQARQFTRKHVFGMRTRIEEFLATSDLEALDGILAEFFTEPVSDREPVVQASRTLTVSRLV